MTEKSPGQDAREAWNDPDADAPEPHPALLDPNDTWRNMPDAIPAKEQPAPELASYRDEVTRITRGRDEARQQREDALAELAGARREGARALEYARERDEARAVAAEALEFARRQTVPGPDRCAAWSERARIGGE